MKKMPRRKALALLRREFGEDYAPPFGTDDLLDQIDHWMDDWPERVELRTTLPSGEERLYQLHAYDDEDHKGGAAFRDGEDWTPTDFATQERAGFNNDNVEEAFARWLDPALVEIAAERRGQRMDDRDFAGTDLRATMERVSRGITEYSTHHASVQGMLQSPGRLQRWFDERVKMCGAVEVYELSLGDNGVGARVVAQHLHSDDGERYWPRNDGAETWLMDYGLASSHGSMRAFLDGDTVTAADGVWTLKFEDVQRYVGRASAFRPATWAIRLRGTPLVLLVVAHVKAMITLNQDRDGADIMVTRSDYKETLHDIRAREFFDRRWGAFLDGGTATEAEVRAAISEMESRVHSMIADEEGDR